MSIQQEIDRIKSNVVDAFSAVAEKGGTLPEEQVSGTLGAAVRSIPVGGSGGSSEGSAGEAYSTEETRIGTWIDGKPLYRKTFKTVYNSVGTKNWMAIGEIPDVEFCVVSGGSIENDAGAFTNLQSSLFRTRFYNGILQLYSENFSSTSPVSSFITVEYTKTTD